MDMTKVPELWDSHRPHLCKHSQPTRLQGREHKKHLLMTATDSMLTDGGCPPAQLTCSSSVWPTLSEWCLYILNGRQKSKRIIIFHDMWKWYEIQIFSVHKVLLEYSNSHLFTYCLWLFLCSMAKLGSCDRDCMTCKAWNRNYLTLQNLTEKKKPTPALVCKLLSAS